LSDETQKTQDPQAFQKETVFHSLACDSIRLARYTGWAS